ncbi:hypothetical protein ACHAXT_001316 [Thalassiosira profunda]
MASSSPPEPVQPSPPLLAALHRRLRDPSLVPSFERRRPRSATGGLVRPRWTLRRPADGDGSQDGGGGGVGAADDSGTKADGGNGGEGVGGERCAASNNAGGARGAPSGPSGAAAAATDCNALPRRSYLDLRLQQNRAFADAQFIICRTRLAAHLPSSNPGRQKHIVAFRSALAEGLAACPTHEGLLRAEREWKARMQEENEAGGDGGTEAAKFASRPNFLANPRADGGTSVANGDNPKTQSLPPRKGAEGRARAAMQDALMERAFLLGDGGGATGEKAAEAAARYPLLAEADELTERGGGQRNKSSRRESSSDSSSSSSDSSRRRRRRKKRSRRRRKKHKRRGKRRRHHHEEEEEGHRSKGDRRRERSRSRSRSESTSSRSSSYRRRKRRKEKRRRRKHRHRSRDERHSDDEGESKTSVDEVGSRAE